MRRLVEETVRSITPHVIPVEADEDWPAADPEESVRFLDDWTARGIPEFSALTAVVFYAFNLYALLATGRTFPRLGFEEQARLMDRLYRMKGPLAFLFLYFLTGPTKNAYFSRVDVQVLLGFDVPSLLEEARLRRVSRSGAALPERQKAQGGEGEEGVS